ncbi:SPFH domain-containing protein [Novosphingobium resinovorum]|uniref:SPFH domain-containing protein n=1 Tax=Novosphingobium TaxID=165696 RepID=UPI001B3C5258|nr:MULTISPECIES: SPFH domain-containing protein [Novosphingobium]MBF7010395.1 SPFH domain-containing protein [Novosphingobium sp. HR1a]WJM28396.1 SPFH domain-containing protein [Novosphingobium resinovorum]
MSDSHLPINASRESIASTRSGYLMLIVFLALLVAIVFCVVTLASGDPGPGTVLGFLAFILPAVIMNVLILSGFYMIQPNQAAAITLFGSYKGTDRTPGLRWVWPWMGKTKISARANNVVSEKLKVNDLRGNPIEIATNVVWRVADTAQALYDVDDYKAFVNVQIEAAVRSIGSRYAYDDVEDAEITLRGSHEQVNAELRTELIARLQVAGITVDECGLTHLAYAPEIAGAMLRRQQAEAVIGARRKLVEGAVSMVEMALAQLSEKNVVELDDERRAAMVSNLMVVLCGERDTQPVVNTGTLYS